jgi:hypothetical protein
MEMLHKRVMASADAHQEAEIIPFEPEPGHTGVGSEAFGARAAGDRSLP